MAVRIGLFPAIVLPEMDRNGVFCVLVSRRGKARVTQRLA
jgi:hypothetical protein